MPIKVIGVGVGRTGTYSLKLAINELGLGPCHHMEEVLHNQPVQVPLWVEALKRNADWGAIFSDYKSAVDWPTARFYQELSEVYPSAKFILTHRSPESWAQSFSQTIYKFLAEKEHAPKEMKAWLDMCGDVISETGFPPNLDIGALESAFIEHNEAVKAAIPAQQLLVYQVKEGWEPLCKFLGKPVPEKPFPRTNDRSEFWDLVSGKSIS